MNDRPHRQNRDDLHPERAPERDGTAPSEMSGCLSEAMRETGGDRQRLMKRRYVTKRYAPDRTGTAPSRHKRRCTPNQGTPSLFRCHSQMGSRVWGYLGIEASSPILEPVILYMGKLGLFAMYVCTRSVQTYLVKDSRGCNRLLLPCKITPIVPD